MAVELRAPKSNDFHDPDFANSAASGLFRHLPITEREARIRIVRIEGFGAAQREDWLNQWIVPVALDCYTPFTLRALLRADLDFDMIVVHADTAEDIIAFTRDCHQMLEGKPIIACLTVAAPSQSAQILQAGADAVVDLAMGNEVAAAYLRSLARRVRMTRGI